MEREAFRNVMDDATPCIHEAGLHAYSYRVFLKGLLEPSGPDVLYSLPGGFQAFHQSLERQFALPAGFAEGHGFCVDSIKFTDHR